MPNQSRMADPGNASLAALLFHDQQPRDFSAIAKMRKLQHLQKRVQKNFVGRNVAFSTCVSRFPTFSAFWAHLNGFCASGKSIILRPFCKTFRPKSTLAAAETVYVWAHTNKVKAALSRWHATPEFHSRWRLVCDLICPRHPAPKETTQLLQAGDRYWIWHIIHMYNKLAQIL